MEGGDRLRRRKSLQERLGLACCGSTWDIGPSNMGIPDDVYQVYPQHTTWDSQDSNLNNLNPDCVYLLPRINLAAALAAERNSRSTDVAAGESEALTAESVDNRTPSGRMSLMRLLEETEDEEDEKEGIERGDQVCCVCMGRKKGAAFIPCGHTFCRVCSRELWLNRGSCPLCNRLILQVLDIF